MTTELMTEKEVNERLDRGESPVAISVDKWRRVAKFLEEDGDIFRINIGPSTCALCVEARFAWNPDDCLRCLYYKHFGQSCIDDEVNSTYCRFEEEYDSEYPSRDVLLDLARDMMYELMEIPTGDEEANSG